MLDLKSKLMEAGLVDDKDVARVKAQDKARRDKKRAMIEKKKQQKQRQREKQQRVRFYNRENIKDRNQWASKIEKLKKEEKNAIYQVTKIWVERARLDPTRPDFSEPLERYAYQKHSGTISFLSVSKQVEEQLRIGDAGIVAYMSDHGLVHAVVPRALAIDIHTIFPEWLRGLNAYEYDLLIEEPVEVAQVEVDDSTSTSPETAPAADSSQEAPADTVREAKPALLEKDDRPAVRLRKKESPTSPESIQGE